MIRAATVALLLSLVLAAPATAKIWFEDMGGRTVHWDQRVVASIVNCSGNPGCGDVVGRRMVYLRRVGGKRLHRLARVDHNGRVRFRVPHLAPGRYRLVAHEGSQTLAVSDPFRLTRGG